MCVIMAKNQGVAFPEDKILKNCWDNNPNMGGFMYALNDRVYIQKGYKTWKEFKDALDNARKRTGDDIPYVLHFRISTQGFGTTCCQPFPLSSKMKALKKCNTQCNIGVAHNGVLELTSDGAKDYSDTMKFITDILSNIILGFDWYQNKRSVKLIENLIVGSRLAILDKFGHIEMLGRGWVEDKGLYFSNSSYAREKTYVTKCYGSGSWNSSYYYDEDYWEDWWEKRNSASVSSHKGEFLGNTIKPYSIDDDDLYGSDYANTYDQYDPYETFLNKDGKYNFTEDMCPYCIDDDDTYCDACVNKCHCKWCVEYKVANK